MITIIWFNFNREQCTSIILAGKHNYVLPYRCTEHHSLQHAMPGKGYRANYEFNVFTFVTFFGAFCTLAFCSTPAMGNVHPNSCPSSVSSDSSLAYRVLSSAC